MVLNSGHCASNFVMFDPSRIDTCGIELGNWYGFAGIPMGTGLASFTELVRMVKSEREAKFEAKVRMFQLDAKIVYSLRTEHNALTTEMTVESLSDGMLGDAVLHLTFASGASSPRFNGVSLKECGRYHYSTQKNSCLELSDVRLKIVTEMDADAARMDLDLVPYAARMADGRIRYHTRALCRGGENSSLILRTRGALSCVRLGKCPAAMQRWLYRVERNASRFLRNTQLCAAAVFPKNAKLRLWHRMQTQ